MEAGTTCSVHPEYARLFEVLATAGVPFCLVRPASGLPDIEKDLDLLVDPGRRTAALDALREAGYLVLRTEFLNPRKIVLVKWTGERVVCLDLHLALVNRGLEYLDARGALARRVEENGIAQLGPADMAAVLFFHDLLGKHHLQEKHRADLSRRLPALAGSDTERDLERRGLAKLLPRDESALASLYDDPVAADALAGRAERTLLRNPRLRLRRVAMRLKRLFRRPARGMSVCFLGPDGSGKSTTMKEFARLVDTELRWPVSTHYMGPWGHYHLPRFMDVMARPVPLTMRQLKERAGAVRAPFMWVRAHVAYWIGLGALGVELWFRYLKLWRAKRRGRLVICDRYVYDFLSGTMHGIEPRYRWARSVLCALYPRPDRIYLLHADPEVLVARKQDLDLAGMKAMQALYAELARRFGMTVVSTESAPPPAVAKGILDRDFALLVEKRRV